MTAVDAASHSLRELRIAEVVKQDMVITDGKVEAYRTKVRVSFKYEGMDRPDCRPLRARMPSPQQIAALLTR